MEITGVKNNWEKMIIAISMAVMACVYIGVMQGSPVCAAESESVVFKKKTLGGYQWTVESVTDKDSRTSGNEQRVVKLHVKNVSQAGRDITHAVLYLFDRNGDRLLTQDFIIPEIPAESVTTGAGSHCLMGTVDSVSMLNGSNHPMDITGERTIEVVCDAFSIPDVADYTIGYAEESTPKAKETENFPVADSEGNHLSPLDIKDNGYLAFHCFDKGKSYIMINMAPQMYRSKILGDYAMRVTCNQNDGGTVQIYLSIENTTGKDLAAQYMNLYLYSYKRDKVGQVLAVKVPELGAHETAALKLETKDIGAVYAFDWNCEISPEIHNMVTQAPQTGLIDYVGGRKALISRNLYVPQKLDGKTIFITCMSYAVGGNKLEYILFRDPQEQAQRFDGAGVYFGNRMDRIAYAYSHSMLSRELPSKVYYTICTAYVHSEAEAAKIDTMLDEDMFDSDGWKEVSHAGKDGVNDGQSGSGQTSQLIHSLKAYLLEKEYIELRWKGALKYDIVILRKNGKKGTYKRYDEITSGSLYYTDRKVKSGKTYYYKVIPLVNGTYSKKDAAQAAEVHIRMPLLVKPKISLKKAAAKKYVRIAFTRYEGNYAQIQVKRDNRYINVPLKKGKISKYKGVYRLKYSTGGKKLLFRARTWRRKNGKKVYSPYSEVRGIRI